MGLKQGISRRCSIQCGCDWRMDEANVNEDLQGSITHDFRVSLYPLVAPIPVMPRRCYATTVCVNASALFANESRCLSIFTRKPLTYQLVPYLVQRLHKLTIKFSIGDTIGDTRDFQVSARKTNNVLQHQHCSIAQALRVAAYLRHCSERNGRPRR